MYQFQGAQRHHSGHPASSPTTYHPQQPNSAFAASPTWPNQPGAPHGSGAAGERRASEPGSNSQPCFNCGNIGHWAQDCPEPRRTMPTSQQQHNRHPFKRQRTDNISSQAYQTPNPNSNFQHQSGHAPQRNQTHPVPGQSWVYRAPPKPSNSSHAWQQNSQAQNPAAHVNQQWNAQRSSSYGQQSPAQGAPNSAGHPGQSWNTQHAQAPGNQYSQQPFNGQQQSGQYGQQQSNQYGQQPSDQYNQQHGRQPPGQSGHQPLNPHAQHQANQYSQAHAQYSPSPASQYLPSPATQYPQASPIQYVQSPGTLNSPADAQYQVQQAQRYQQAPQYQQDPNFQQGIAHGQQQSAQLSQHVSSYQHQPPQHQQSTAHYPQSPATQYSPQVSQTSAQQYSNHQSPQQASPAQYPQYTQPGSHTISPATNGPVPHFVKPYLGSISSKTEAGDDSLSHGVSQVEQEIEEWWDDLKDLDYPEDRHLNARYPANPVAQALPSFMPEDGQLLKLPIASSLPLGVPISLYFRESLDLAPGLRKDKDPITHEFSDSGKLMSKEDLASSQYNMASYDRESSEASDFSGEYVPQEDARPAMLHEKSHSAPAADGIPTPSNSHESEEERLSREQEERLAALGVTGLAKPVKRQPRVSAISTQPASTAGPPSPALPGAPHSRASFQNDHSRGNSSAGSPAVDLRQEDFQTPPTTDQFDSRNTSHDLPEQYTSSKPNPFDVNVKASMGLLPGHHGSTILKSPEERTDHDRSAPPTDPGDERLNHESQRQAAQRATEYVRKRSARELSPNADDGPKRQVTLHMPKAKAKRNAPKVDAAYSRRW